MGFRAAARTGPTARRRRLAALTMRPGPDDVARSR